MKTHGVAVRLLLIGALSPALGACLDFTPVAVQPMEGGDPDADIDPPDASVDVAACEVCVKGPTCSTEFAACTGTPKCTEMFTCGAAQGCYSAGANLVGCLTICGQQVQLSGQDDPAVGPFLALYQCATKNCSLPCSLP
jgi:hypothetical protein